ESWKELTFRTCDIFDDFFLNYAHEAGFSVRKASTVIRKCPSDGVVRERYAWRVCSREGYRDGSPLDPKNGGLRDATAKGRIIPEDRIGCKALINVRWSEKKHEYHIVEWRVDHNHPLTIPEHRQFINSARSITPLTALLSKMHDQVGVPLRSTFDLLAKCSGGRDKVGCTRRDLQNHRDLVRRTPLKDGEGRWLYDYFMGVKAKDPSFFYKVKIDDNCQIESIFWADGTMQTDYFYFADSISFDTTYRTNDQFRPLGVFSAFNHHRMLTVLGAALLFEETTESFEWLFETLLECMRGRHPRSIFTDQCPAIAAGIRSKFPGTFHGLCTFHIRENASRKMGIELANRVYESGFTKAMFGVHTVEQFQYNWDRMVQSTFTNHGTEVHSWLVYIYNFREQWSSAWVNKNRTCGMRSSQLSESLNSSLRGYLDTKTNLPTFFGEFSRMLDNKRHEELYQDYLATSRKVTNFFQKSPLVTQAAEVYTPKIFTNFQDEYSNCMDLAMRGGMPVLAKGVVYTCSWFKFSLTGQVNQDEEHTVTFKLDPFDYDCSCDLFDSSGWLCRHIMKTMDTISSSGITAAWTIPSKFLLSRWSTNAKIGGAIHGCAVECFDMETQFGRFQRLCGTALPLATDASQHVQITDFVEEQLKQLQADVCAKLLHLRIVEPTQSPATTSGKLSCLMNTMYLIRLVTKSVFFSRLFAS
ncbi:Protein FAR1-RELATED SEQUENCE 5, partial [Linum perenne]